MPGTTSTALLSFSHDQHHETDVAKREGVVSAAGSNVAASSQMSGQLVTDCCTTESGQELVWQNHQLSTDLYLSR